MKQLREKVLRRRFFLACLRHVLRSLAVLGTLSLCVLAFFKMFSIETELVKVVAAMAVLMASTLFHFVSKRPKDEAFLAYMRAVNSGVAKHPEKGPPMHAEKLIYLILPASDTTDAIIGDLEERYERAANRYGVKYANGWYWRQALGSVVPFLWNRVRKILTLTAVAKGAHTVWKWWM
jgi:hypothetical protein